jgi:hypothetical protein
MKTVQTVAAWLNNAIATVRRTDGCFLVAVDVRYLWVHHCRACHDHEYPLDVSLQVGATEQLVDLPSMYLQLGQ